MPSPSPSAAPTIKDDPLDSTFEPIGKQTNLSVATVKNDARQHVIVIGAGFSGLAAAAVLAKRGYRVTVFEKNEHPGGSAIKFEKSGFTFDTVPAWYTQPAVFEGFFAKFGKKPSDYYKLTRVDPSCRIFFTPNDLFDVSSDMERMASGLEAIEPGAGNRYVDYLREAKIIYDDSLKEFLSQQKPGNFQALRDSLRLHLLENLDHYTKRFFQATRVRRILEYPVLLVGGDPKSAPANYARLAYADAAFGVWHPSGGMHTVATALYKLCLELGIFFKFNMPVTRIVVQQRRAVGVETARGELRADAVVCATDYVHAEVSLLDKEFRSHSSRYWNSRAIGPSALVIHLGVKKKLSKLRHHNFFFPHDPDRHFEQVFSHPDWPSLPHYLVTIPSRTDRTLAPTGSECISIIVPVAPGLLDDDATRERYATMVINHLEGLASETFADDIIFRRIFSHRDFEHLYNAHKGTVFGLAPLPRQSLPFLPSALSRRVKGLFYAGHYTRPGLGIPESLISGEHAANFADIEVKSRPLKLSTMR